jgi:trimeric autotransporter adhesin
MTVVMTLIVAACGSNSPTSPTTGSIASVTLAVASVTAGSTVQGTVTLTSTAGASGATVGLSSSNSAVATVPASVTVASGATTASFQVTGVASGTATITATMNGSMQSPALTVSAGPQLATLTVSPATVVGGTNVTGTVTLTSAAPGNGAAVTLSSDATLIVPASVTVVAGATTATFSVVTQVVGGPVNATIRGTYGGATATAVVALTRPAVATASFGVTGAQVTETCAVINNGAALDCTFNGSTSGAPGNITAYDWTWSVTGSPRVQTTAGPVFANPSFSCSMVPPPPLPAAGMLAMTVTLKIHDDLGNVSAVATDANIRLLPQGSCGY